MYIYLMRHGETDWNKQRRLQGQSDIPLNENGIDLAVKTAAKTTDIHFDAAFSSPLQRAYKTAQIVSENSNIEIEKDDRLKEINFGTSEGQCFDVAKQNPDHPLHNFFCKPEDFRPTDGAETFEEARRRAKDFFEEKIYPLEKTCKNVLVVAHGAYNRCILNVLEGIPDSDFWHIDLPNCSVSILELQDGKLSLVEESKVYYGTPVNGRP